MKALKGSLEPVWEGFKLLLFPQACLLCQEPRAALEWRLFCLECQGCFEWIDPLEEALNKSQECKEEIKTPYIRKTLATFSYEGAAESLVQAYKVGRRSYLAEGMGALMCLQWLEGGLPFPDYLVPVPSSPLSNYKRGFSPSLLLAEVLSKLMKRPLWKGLGAEVTFLKQSYRTQEERRALPADHIYLKQSTEPLKDKHLLLIDDVMTTGHTLHLASQTLLEGYPKQIDALLFAQV